MNPNELSWFDWATVAAILLVLVGIVGVLFGLIIRSIYGELNRLATTISKVNDQFQTHQIEEIRSSIKYIQREEWLADCIEGKERARRIHDRIDEVLSRMNVIAQTAVTKDDCHNMHEQLRNDYAKKD